MIQRAAVIVGAGPAGLSAAITLAECGVRPTVIDENPAVGGQIYRAVPDAFGDPPPARGAVSQRGARLKQRALELGDAIEYRLATKVWGIFPPRQLAVVEPGGWQMIEAERLVLAPGAYEMVPPFPGWTLPGVMTPGGAQLMAKSMGVLPGQRAIVAGTGPFLLVVANCLQQVGVKVVAVVEAVTRRETLAALPKLIEHFGLVRQGWQYYRQLRRAGVPIRTGQMVVQAEGAELLERVQLAPCDRQWRVDRSRIEAVDADLLCVGFGFVPRAELAQLAGCRLLWNEAGGGWVPEAGNDMASSAEAVWVAGDGAGVAGALVAEHEGTLAGLSLARACGAIDEVECDRRRHPVLAALNKLRRFRAVLDRLSAIRPGLSELADGQTVVCRCEEVRRDEVELAIQSGCTTCRTLKTATRLGMGKCQGRMCWPATARFLAAGTGQSLSEMEPFSVRPPTVPITLGQLAETSLADQE